MEPVGDPTPWQRWVITYNCVNLIAIFVAYANDIPNHSPAYKVPIGQQSLQLGETAVTNTKRILIEVLTMIQKSEPTLITDCNAIQAIHLQYQDFSHPDGLLHLTVLIQQLLPRGHFG